MRRRRPSLLQRYRSHWHSVCLTVFLVIVIVDFLVMPLWTEYANQQLTAERIVELTQAYQANGQIAALQALLAKRIWQPLTLSQSGMFYVAFGAILGVGAWTRSNEKKHHGPPAGHQPIPTIEH